MMRIRVLFYAVTSRHAKHLRRLALPLLGREGQMQPQNATPLVWLSLALIDRTYNLWLSLSSSDFANKALRFECLEGKP